MNHFIRAPGVQSNIVGWRLDLSVAAYLYAFSCQAPLYVYGKRFYENFAMGCVFQLAVFGERGERGIKVLSDCMDRLRGWWAAGFLLERHLLISFSWFHFGWIVGGRRLKEFGHDFSRKLYLSEAIWRRILVAREAADVRTIFRNKLPSRVF